VRSLPTEAQWNMPARAGTTSVYSFGNPISVRISGVLRDYAWFVGDSEAKTHTVGQKKANPWGLYDMHGNVGEWCATAWLYSADETIGPQSAHHKGTDG